MYFSRPVNGFQPEIWKSNITLNLKNKLVKEFKYRWVNPIPNSLIDKEYPPLVVLRRMKSQGCWRSGRLRYVVTPAHIWFSCLPLCQFSWMTIFPNSLVDKAPPLLDVLSCIESWRNRRSGCLWYLVTHAHASPAFHFANITGLPFSQFPWWERLLHSSLFYPAWRAEETDVPDACNT